MVSLSMSSNIRNVMLINGILVDVPDENLPDENPEYTLNAFNAFNTYNTTDRTNISYISDISNTEIINEINNLITERLHNEIMLFLINRDDASYYLFYGEENQSKKNTLTQEQFEKLEKVTSITTCAICMEDSENNVKLECKHSFCTECIQKWLLKKSDTCPTCRIQIK
jgi:hypothetical protein